MILDSNSNILWSDRPRTKYYSTLLNGGGVNLWYIWGLASMLLFFGGAFFAAIKAGSNFFTILFGFISLILLFFPDYLKSRRKKLTKYAYTSDSVIFVLGRHKRLYNEVSFDEIEQICKEKKKGSNMGNIVFHMKKKPKFETYSFVDEKAFGNPTFEDIEHVDIVFSDLQKLLKGVPPQKPSD